MRLMEDEARTAYLGTRWSQYTPSQLLKEKSYTPSVSTPTRVSSMQKVELKIREGTLYSEARKKAVLKSPLASKIKIAPTPAVRAAKPILLASQTKGGGEKPMALSLLAEFASSALKAAKSPTGQQLIGGALGAVSGALPTIGAPGRTYTVFRKNGRLVDMATGRTLGYTPQAAKKKYRTRRRRRRWTQADERKMQWQAHMTAIAAGQASVAPPPM